MSDYEMHLPPAPPMPTCATCGGPFIIGNKKGDKLVIIERETDGALFHEKCYRRTE